MGTSFTTVYNRFLGKITDDMYLELTPEDTIRDIRTLLIDALPAFEFCKKDLFNYTISTSSKSQSEIDENDFVMTTSEEEVIVESSAFGEELTSEEINIIAILMMNGWVQRQLTSIENTRMKYSGSDFKFTSQANHLAKLQSLLGECQRQSHHYQRLYGRREINKEGKYQSTWYWFGDHNVYKN